MTRQNANTIILFLILAAVIVGCIAVYQAVQSMNQAVQRTADLPGQTVGELQTRVAQLQNPTPTVRPDPVTIVLKIQNLSRLETASYTIEKVISAESNQGPWGWLFGDRLLFVAHGEVIAGVDLDKLKARDIFVLGDDRVAITMPAAEILVARLDNQKSYVYERDTGILRGAGDIHLETTARQAAESEILNAAIEDGILKLAESNAQSVVQRLLLSLGFTQVQFIVATPVPTATPGPTPTPG